MKKVSMIFAVICVVAGLTSNAFADPGWAKGRSDDHRNRYEEPYQKHDRWDSRDYRDHRDFRNPPGFHRRPVIVHPVPVAPPRPVVRVYEPAVPSVSLYFPNFSIQFR